MNAVRSAISDLIARRLWPIALVLLAVPGILLVVMSGGGGPVSLPTLTAPPPLAPAPALTISSPRPPAGGDRPGAERNPFRTVHIAPAITSSAPAPPHQPTTTKPTAVHAKPVPKTAPSAPTKAGATAPATALSPVDTTLKVSVRFGAAGDLSTHRGVARLTALPALGPPVVVFSGVLADHVTARFDLAAGARAAGAGVCRPSTAVCQSIDLRVGDHEAVVLTGKSYDIQLASVGVGTAADPLRTSYGTRLRVGPAGVAHAHPVARLAPLGPSTDPVVQYIGVAADGQTAAFLVGSDADSSGQGTCVDAGACRMIALRPGEARTVTSHPAGGSAVSTRIEVVSVRAHVTSRTTAAKAHRRVDAAGRVLLRTLIRDPRVATVLAGYNYSARLGIVLPSARSAAARP